MRFVRSACCGTAMEARACCERCGEVRGRIPTCQKDDDRMTVYGRVSGGLVLSL